MACPEPIEGKWKNGPIKVVEIKPCGGKDFCLKMTTGDHTGREIGKLTGSGQDYSGQITDPGDNKTYSGYGTAKGNQLHLKGCALKIFCQSVIWKRL